ncbi:hypothetical protein FKM82_009014 [Ascaphus truei]
MADLSINFSVEYETVSKKVIPALFLLSEKALVNKNSSTCGKENISAPLLAIQFGDQQLRMNFTRNGLRYQVAELVFIYDLSDKVLFPDASDNGTKEVSSQNTDISANNNSTYKCSNPHLIKMGKVNATFHNIKIEAFVTNNTYSLKETACSEDVTPTVAPTPAPITPKPTVLPTPLPPPSVGQYSVTGPSGMCILAKMGLQLNISYSKKDNKDDLYVFNIDPKDTHYNGTCQNASATLSLSSNKTNLEFQFALNTSTNQFYLARVTLNTTLPSEAKDPNVQVANGSLMYLKTTARKSYRCNAKQTLQITSNFSINTFELQVQAFDVVGDKFGSAVECQLDENGMLVPIVVGAALAGLVLIVLIAYLIGRKRSHAGYQTI